MLRRATVIAATLLVTLAAGAGEAVAQLDGNSTWDQAAAVADFPVYKPDRTLGLKAAVDFDGNDCISDHDTIEVRAGYGLSRAGTTKPRFGIYEASPFVCGNPGESLVYRHVRVRGQRVQLRASCEVSYDPCTLKPGRKHAWLIGLSFRGGPELPVTRIQVIGSFMTAKRFMRIVRSLRRVRVDRPVVHLHNFLTEDRQTWCILGISDYNTDATCATKNGAYGAALTPSGVLTLCANETYPCLQNWDENAPVLAAGQSTRAGAYQCLGEAVAVTCTIRRGASQGVGFHVSQTESSASGPAP